MLITGHLAQGGGGGGGCFSRDSAGKGAHFTCTDMVTDPPGSPVITTLGLQGETTPEESLQAMVRPAKQQQQRTQFFKTECKAICA